MYALYTNLKSQFNPLASIALLISFIFSLPLIYILIRLLTDFNNLSNKIDFSETAYAFYNTMTLGIAVTATSLFLGVFLAWLIA